MLFVIHSFPAIGEGLRAYRFLSTEGTLAVSKDPGFPAKAQAGFSMEDGIFLLYNDMFGFSGSIGYESLLPSSLDLGFGYKGFSAFTTGLRMNVRTPVLSSAPDGVSMYVGSSAGLTGAFARYTGLPHYFFYLAVEIEPIFDIVPPSGKRWFLRTSVPLVFRLRRDTDLSMSVGLSLYFFHEPAFSLIPKREGNTL